MSGLECKVNVQICGGRYVLKGDGTPEHLAMLAALVDSRISLVMEKNPRLNHLQAAVLTALNLADDMTKLRKELESSGMSEGAGDLP